MAAILAGEAPLQSRIVDDKSPICIPFILEQLRLAREEAEAAGRQASRRPFIIGLNGVQGVGKTTLVKALAETLQQREQLQTLVVSIDDFYLTHAAQLALAETHPDNALVQYRGEPGTHDVALMRDFFNAVCDGREARVPVYDKAAFSGLGDRAPESAWPTVNAPGQPPLQVVIMEGWCVGFRPVPDVEVEAKWRAPAPPEGGSGRKTTLHAHMLEHLLFINHQLEDYSVVVTDLLDAFVHVDAEDTELVYGWRLQQEAQLRHERGVGMTDEQVVKFVDAYYPAYELFSDRLRAGALRPGRPGRQLRLVVGKDRSVVDKMVI